MDNPAFNAETKATDIFLKLGFEQVVINSKKVYCNARGYYRLAFVQSFNGFVIEYADSFNDACNNRYEDGDTIPISLGEEEFLQLLENTLVKYYSIP